MKVDVKKWGFNEGPEDFISNFRNSAISDYLECIKDCNDHHDLYIGSDGRLTFSMCTNNESLYEPGSFHVKASISEVVEDGVGLLSDCNEFELIERLKAELEESLAFVNKALEGRINEGS